jgi:hypothetical protein
MFLAHKPASPLVEMFYFVRSRRHELEQSRTLITIGPTPVVEYHPFRRLLYYYHSFRRKVNKGQSVRKVCKCALWRDKRVCIRVRVCQQFDLVLCVRAYVCMVWWKRKMSEKWKSEKVNKKWKSEQVNEKWTRVKACGKCVNVRCGVWNVFVRVGEGVSNLILCLLVYVHAYVCMLWWKWKSERKVKKLRAPRSLKKWVLMRGVCICLIAAMSECCVGLPVCVLWTVWLRNEKSEIRVNRN